MTDYDNHAEYKISMEECDKITAHSLKHYRKLISEAGRTASHPEDIKYNKKLKKSINFILDYLGERDDN